LAEGAGREEIQELFQKRYEVYRQSADITIDGTGELEEQIKELSGYFLL
jgi:shikimate kinase